MSGSKTVCVSCDYLTEDHEALELNNPDEIEYHKSLKHTVKEVYVNPKGSSDLVLELSEFIIKNTKKIILSQNDSSRIYAIVSVDDHCETIELGTQRSIDWLTQAYYSQTKKIHSPSSYENAINFVRSTSIFSSKVIEEKIYRRIAFDGEKFYIDLGRKDWQIFEITKDSRKMIPYSEKTPVFIRSKNMSIQVEPCLNYNGNPLEEFGKLVRIDNDLFKVHVICNFLEGIPTPIMANLGHAGGAKTTVSGMIRQIIDPAGSSITDNVTAFPHNTENFSVQFQNNYLIAYENISSINQEKSDILCRVTTGNTITTRKHYSNDEEHLMKFQRKVILNGIEFNMSYEDLADRTIQYWFERIPEDQRMSDEEVDNKFKKLLPHLLGQISEILQKSLTLYSKVKKECKHLPRMASFALWGESIYQSLGHKQGEFLELYKKAIQKNNDTLFENNPIISFLDYLLDKKQELKIQTSEFYKRLKNWAEENNYDDQKLLPKSPGRVRAYITRSKQLLDEHRFSIVLDTNTERNEFTIGSTVLTVKRILEL